MNIDDIDIKIISIFYNLKAGEKTNYYVITKKVYDKNDSYNHQKKYHLIKCRLKKLSDYGLIKISCNNNTVIFELQMENVNFCKRKFKNGFCDVVELKINGGWVSFDKKLLKKIQQSI